jgi:hypothetical protein
MKKKQYCLHFGTDPNSDPLIRTTDLVDPDPALFAKIPTKIRFSFEVAYIS